MENQTVEDKAAIVEVTHKPACILEAKVTLKQPEVDKCHKQAVKQVNKRISIPGFRKGKAPSATVIERYGSNIDQEFRENAIQAAFQKTLELSKVYPINKEAIERPKVTRCSTDEGVEIVIAYEHLPEVPEIDFSKITLPEVKKESVAKERVDQIVEDIRKSHAEYEEQNENAVKENDYVDLTIQAYFEPETEGGERPKRPVIEKRRFAVTDEMRPWLKALVLGMKVGEVKPGVTEVEPEATEQEKADFKAMDIEVELLGIFKMQLPEFNEELAQKVGAKTTDEVLEKINHNLDLEAADKQKNKQIEHLEEKLLETVQFDIPESIRDGERRERLARKLEQLKAKKLSDEEIKNHQKELQESVELEVDRSLRLYFINQQIARQGNVTLSKEELNAILADEVSRNPHIYQQDMKSAEIQDRVERIKSLAFQRKTEDYALAEVLQKCEK